MQAEIERKVPSTRLPPTTARASIAAVFVVFVCNGFNFASWVARLPAIRDALGLVPARLGLLLLVGSCGSLLALPTSGLVAQRLGSRMAVRVFAAVQGTGLLVAAGGVTVGSVPVVVCGLLMFGLGNAIWDTAMNLEGAAVEQRVGWSVMPRFHAGFSFGTMAGATLGAITAWTNVSLMAHMAGALVVSVAGVAWATRWFSSTRGDNPTMESAHRARDTRPAPRARILAAWRESRTLRIGGVVLSAALTEGAASDWVSLAIVDGFGTSHSMGALGFGLFVTAMTSMRFLGTHLLDRYGRVWVLRWSAILSAVGLVLFALSPSLSLAMPGVACWGMGAALGFPIGMSAAADDPSLAPTRVSVVATMGYSAFLAGPALLGLLASVVGYRHALLAVVVSVVIGWFMIGAAKPLHPGIRPSMVSLRGSRP